MIEIDEAIGRVGTLYHAVTGREAPQGEHPYAPIPAEVDPVTHVHEQMDRLLFALGEPPGYQAAPTRAFSPAVAVWENDQEVVVLVDLPGVPREHVDVVAQGNVVVIRGRRDSALGQHRLRVAEQPLGPFRRLVPLPPGLLTSEMRAQLRDGVLEVKIPRDAATAARTVPVS